MNLFITGTAVNLLVNLFFFYLVRKACGQAVNLGWQQADFRAERLKVRNYRRRIRTPYLYRVNLCFRGSHYSVSVSKEEYEELLLNRTGRAMFYVREFSGRFLLPDFDQYEFSLRETDWDRQDRGRCLKGVLTVFAPLELILGIIAAGI